MQGLEYREPRKSLRKTIRNAKLLRPADLPDNFTRSLYKIAPYKGCAHGCRYCDGRAERYFVSGDFERDIEVRDSIPNRLAAELALVREYGMIAFGSGVTDPYQPLELENAISGRCARILTESTETLPALVMTKSSLVLRDLVLWKQVNERAGFILLVSLTSLDESLREMMEPGASSFAARIEMIRQFKTAGCIVGVLAMPLLPGLSDCSDSIRTLFRACAEAGADFIMPGGLTLRPGRQKDFYLNVLARYKPDLLGKTTDLYRSGHPTGSPTFATKQSLREKIFPIQQEIALPYLLPHRLFARLLPPHDTLRILLRDMLELYSERGIDISALVSSADAYDKWLLSLRRSFRHRRNLANAWLGERFLEAEKDGELATILANRRLSNFVASTIREGARLNYRTLKLEQGIQ